MTKKHQHSDGSFGFAPSDGNGRRHEPEWGRVVPFPQIAARPEPVSTQQDANWVVRPKVRETPSPQPQTTPELSRASGPGQSDVNPKAPFWPYETYDPASRETMTEPLSTDRQYRPLASTSRQGLKRWLILGLFAGAYLFGIAGLWSIYQSFDGPEATSLSPTANPEPAPLAPIEEEIDLRDALLHGPIRPKFRPDPGEDLAKATVRGQG